MVTEEQIKKLAHAIWEQEEPRFIELVPPIPLVELAPPPPIVLLAQVPSKRRRQARRKEN